MNSPAQSAGGVSRGLVEYSHVIYALLALSVLAALAGLQTVALRFAFGLPSIIAVILCYARRALPLPA